MTLNLGQLARWVLDQSPTQTQYAEDRVRRLAELALGEQRRTIELARRTTELQAAVRHATARAEDAEARVERVTAFRDQCRERARFNATRAMHGPWLDARAVDEQLTAALTGQ